jgi:hypothetical protein
MSTTTETPAVTEPASEAVTEAAPAASTGAVLAIRPQVHTLPAKIQYAQELANSGLLPAAFRRQPANVLFAIEYGEMLGLAPMAAITGIHVIEGKPSASAGLISALVRRAGHKLRVTGDARSATCQIVRCDDPDYTFSVTWTLRKNGDGNPCAEDAKLLAKEVWQKYAASMLKSRAITQCARDACEEALFGLHYTPEELGAEVDEDGHVYGGSILSDTPPAVQQPAEDTWYMRPAAGEPAPHEWFDEALARARAESLTKDEAGNLWTEATARNKAGTLPDDYSRQLKSVLTERREAFKATADADIVDAVIVPDPPLTVYGLDPEDDWAPKVTSIAGQEDADAAAADVATGVDAGHITPERADVITAAIDARLAELAGKKAAA